MKLFRKEDIKSFTAPKGEIIHQYVGRLEKNGSSKLHSLAIMTILPGLASDPHCHRVAEESFFVLRGRGYMEVNDEKIPVEVGDCVFVEPGERHSLVNNGSEPMECLLVTAPAWHPEDSISEAPPAYDASP